MSIIHVNQIRGQVLRLFESRVDLSDLRHPPEEMRLSMLLSRGLAAYAIHILSGTTPDIAAASVVDGSDDNGIDAIFYDEANKRLYVVQSKWMHDGSGEPSNGDVKKFVAGVRDLFNLRFDRFNAKIRGKQASVVHALNDPQTKYELVIAYTGSSRLSTPSQRDLDDIAQEMNDTSEVVFISPLNQAELHNSLTAGVGGEPINAELGLKSWGKKEEPHVAFYGQITAAAIAELWSKYRARLFARNLRSTLGETDVNREMRQTLEERGESFWYFNNGITILAKRVARAMAGGGGNDFATFHCEDISVVNGAQTVGTLGKVGQGDPARLENVYVQVRVIVRGDDETFADSVTRTNNRQNRVESRDFVALDPEQGRIRTELAIDGIDYQVMRTEDFLRAEKAFDLIESTTALACASGSVRLVVQLKREIGKLWEDITRAPYKELFNATTPGPYVWRVVQVQRKVDKALDTFFRRGGLYKHYAVATHGNRMISAMVFANLPGQFLRDPATDLEAEIVDVSIANQVDAAVVALSTQVERLYPNAMVPILFKNLSKCEQLWAAVRT